MLPDFTLSTFSTASPQAREITTLFINVLLVCSVIFVIVTVWVGYSIWKFRDRGEAGEPDQHQIPKAYEVTWTIIPALICVLLGYWTVASMFGPRSGEVDGQPDPDIIITGAQWWWDVRYPKLDIVTANEIHVPTGKPLIVELESNDVIHTFWIPDLGRKEQMIPGHHSLIKIQSDRVAEYLGACAQYCGNQHAWMRLRLISESPADFEAWAAKQKTKGEMPRYLVTRTATAPLSNLHHYDESPAPLAANGGMAAPVPLASTMATSVAGGVGTIASNGANAKAKVPMPVSPDASVHGDVARGLTVYQQQTCGTCHAIEGVSAAPYAPNLTHIASRHTLAAGVLTNTPDNLYKWMANPQAYKPGCNMPNFHLTPEQTSDIVAYLETLQ